MPETNARSTSLESSAAIAAAILFALHLFSYFVPALRDATLQTLAVPAVALAVLAVVQHLVVFPVAATLPAPRWAVFAAYIWLVVDMLTDVAQLGGAPKSAYLPVRLAVNVLAALWIASASFRQRATFRILGVVIAVDLILYSAFGLLSPAAFLITLPSLVLLPVWFWLVGRMLACGVGVAGSMVGSRGQAV